MYRSCASMPACFWGDVLGDIYNSGFLNVSSQEFVPYFANCFCHFTNPDMAARKSVLVVSVAPSNAIANIASELASRGHFTIFASVNPSKHFKDSSYSGNLQNIEIDPQSPASIFRASIAVASTLSARGFSGLDVLINDVGVGSSLALLDVMIDESPETYNSKISDALSLATSFASLLATSRGKVVNISSSGAMISAPCMSKSLVHVK